MSLVPAPGPPQRRRRWLIVGAAAVVLVAAGIAIAVTNPFASPSSSGNGVTDNTYPIAYATVQLEPLQSQTEVQGTLTYASTNDSSATASMVLPAGTATSTVQQAQQLVATARQNLSADQTALLTTEASNSENMAQAQQAVSADKVSLALAKAANSEDLSQARQGTSSARANLASTNASNSQSLAQAQQSVSQDEAALKTTETSNSQSLAEAQQAVSQDEAALKTTEMSNSQSLAEAQQAVSQDEAALKTTETSNSQSLAEAQQQLEVASAALGADQAQLASDEARLSADEQKEAVDCAAGGAAAPKGQGTTSACSADEGQVADDQSAVAADKQKITSDEAAVQSDQGDIASAKTKNSQSLQQAEAQLQAARQAVASTMVKNSQSVQQANAQLLAAQQAVASTKTKNAQSVQQAQAQLVAAEDAVAATKVKDAQSAQAAQSQLQAAEQDVPASATKNEQSLQQAEAQLSAAEASVAAAKTKNEQSLQQAQAQLAAARLAVSQDESALADDEADAAVGTTGGSGSPTYTYLPQVGQVIRLGQELYAIDGQPSILLYGNVTPWRAFGPGMSPGPDVAALNLDLRALGDGSDLRGDDFTGATEAAVKQFQSAEHMDVTGQLPLGSVLFQPGAIEVNSVTPTLGSTPSAGQAVLEVTLTARQVQIALDASQQSEVEVGDKVSIVMPDNSTTPGVVTYVGTVATAPSSQNGGSGNPTINVYVTPLDPAATGDLDDLPVNVWVTTASVPSAYVVPVDALVALAGGGYALEVAPTRSAHYLEAVSIGLFDDADGNVQVSGPGVHAGQRVVVPQV